MKYSILIPVAEAQDSGFIYFVKTYIYSNNITNKVDMDTLGTQTNNTGNIDKH